MLEKTITCIQDYFVGYARAFIDKYDFPPNGVSFLRHSNEVIDDFKKEYLPDLTRKVLDFWNKEKSNYPEVESIPDDVYRECLEEIDFFDYAPDFEKYDLNNPVRDYELREGVSREEGEALEAEGREVDEEYSRDEEEIENHVSGLERDLAQLRLPQRRTREHRLQELEVEYVYCTNVGRLLRLVEEELGLKCQSRQAQVNVVEAEKEVGMCPAGKRELFYKRAAECFPD